MKCLLTAFCLFACLANTAVLAKDSIIVSAASSLRQVWPQLIQNFSDANRVKVTFGSSGNLSRQIMQGAPFDVFISANRAYPETLKQKGHTTGPLVPLAHGELAWAASLDSPLANWIESGSTEPLHTLLLSNTQTPYRLAIANPRFAPYGMAAQDVLEFNNIASQDIVLSIAENASQTLQFTLSGAIDMGIVPLSLLKLNAETQQSNLVYRAIDPATHRPLEYVMVKLTDKTEHSNTLINYLKSEHAQTILHSVGLTSAK